jgi:DNA polymerase-3 subunit beta
MKFSIEQSNLAATLQRVGPALDAKDPIRSCYRVEVTAQNGVVFTASNMDLTIRESVQAASSEGTGTVLVPGKLLGSIVKSAQNGDVCVETTDSGSITVTTAAGSFAVPTPPNEKFVSPSAPSGDGSTIDSGTFAAAVRQVAAAASKDFSRPTLTGVLVAPSDGGLRLVATDTYRLAVKDVPSAGHILGEDGVIIPAANLLLALKALDSAATLTVVHDTSRVGITGGSTQVTLSLIQGEFPSYDRVLPTTHTGAFNVGASELFEDVSAAALMADDSTKVVKVNLSPAKSSVHSVSDGGSFTGVGIGTFTGEAVELGFKTQYLAEGITAVGSSNVVVETNGSDAPVVLRDPQDPGFRYLLMPVKG